ncbi:MAG: DUF1428 family protein [Thermoplasmata archaeon]
MTFVQVYIYRVPSKRAAEFLRVAKAARDIYRRHGAAGEEFFRLQSSDRKYPEIPGLWEVVPPGEGEELWVGIDRYRSEKKCAEVAAAVDHDPEILALFERVVDLVGGAARMVHAAFEEPP